jgi:hypothetical protein
MDVNPSDGLDDSERAEMSGMGDPDPDYAREGSLFDALFRTDGGAPVEEIEHEYGADRPTSLIIRGMMKMGGEERFPAIADLCAGIVLLTLRYQGQGHAQDAQEGDRGVGADAFGEDFTD